MISAAILSPSASKQPLDRGGVVEAARRGSSRPSRRARPSSGARRRVRRGHPSRRCPGSTEYMSWSTWPWYEPSILAITSRPVAARATRMAVMVDSVPEFVKRTWSALNRRHSSSARSTHAPTVTAKCMPLRAACSTASATIGLAWPDGHRAEPVVEVVVLVAVDVPHLGAHARARGRGDRGRRAGSDEATPPGIEREARSNIAFEAGVRLIRRLSSESASSRARAVIRSSVVGAMLPMGRASSRG